MPDGLYALPDDAIIALSVAAVAGATAVALLVCRHVVRLRVTPEQSGVIWDAYRAVVSLTALVLAFSLVQAQTNLRNVEAGLRREAAALLEADHEILRLGGDAAAGLRRALQDYGRAILSDEWPRLTSGGRSPQVDGILVGLLHAARGIEQASLPAPPHRGELMRQLDQLSDLREERITSATLRLPRAFWRATGALVVVTVVLAGAMPWTARHLLSVFLVSAALAVLAALVAIVDVPFRGESAVRPTELRRALDAIPWQG
jgi:hypothetical protein